MKVLESEFHAWMGGIQARMETVLARLLPPPAVLPARLHEAMRYATLEGGKRVRPLLMSTATTVIGLMPIFLTYGRGSDVMQPMAIPSVGGMAVNLITLFIAPCIYCLVQEAQLRWRLSRRPANPYVPG